MNEVGKVRLFISIIVLIIIIGLIGLIGTKKLRFFEVSSASMEPTLQIGDKIFMWRAGFYDYGHIIAFPHPNEPEGAPMVKRVMAVGGDHVKLIRGILYVNGEPVMSSSVTTNRIDTDDYYTEVPDEHVWVLGDNRNESEDSLNFGPIDEAAILGRMTIRYWPFNRFGKIKDPAEVEDEEE